jgi:hypothetical protein
VLTRSAASELTASSRATPARRGCAPGRCGARRRTRGTRRAARRRRAALGPRRANAKSMDRVVAVVGDEAAALLRAVGERGAASRRRSGRSRENARMPAGAGPVGAEAERVAHHRAHREAAQDGPLGRRARALPSSSCSCASASVGGVEGVGVRVADARHDVPVVAGPARELQRRARGDHVQPPLRVQHVGEPSRSCSSAPRPWWRHDHAGGLAGGRPLAVDERAHASTRGFETGVKFDSR